MKHNSVPKMSIKVSICLKSIKSICIIGAQLKLHFPSRPTVKSSHSKGKSLSHVQLFATPWTVSYQALRSMGFSRQEYWSGLPFPSPGDLPNPGYWLELTQILETSPQFLDTTHCSLSQVLFQLDGSLHLAHKVLLQLQSLRKTVL